MLASRLNLPPGAVEQRYDYYSYAPAEDSPFTRDEFSIDVARRIHWRGHSGVGIKLCPPGADYYCFDGRALDFAVPKKPLVKDQSWEWNGRTFRVLGDERLEVLGSDEHAWLIASDRGGDKLRYHYSERAGLLSLAIPIEGSHDYKIYFSKSTCGFPMVPTTSEGPPGCRAPP
jgi:hypothetical protein